MHPHNLLSDQPTHLTQEQADTLVENPHTKLIRIISPPHFRSQLFLQQEDEWVMVLQGEGVLEIAGAPVQIGPGDSLLIPAGTPHRVVDTSAEPACIWLALHMHAGNPIAGDRE
ncbi:cupin domain-containing protein [Sedimenticola sp.]|uniref:cupin domain-containing protein n=1 Tax=Sedimenticola sp. TaxID=1940285 RepID=UPI003D0EB7E6